MWRRGERVILFGPSGCGKSTVLHLIAGLAIPDSGDILIDGEHVATASKIFDEPEQRGIGMVFQDLALWPHMTVAENIEFGLTAKRMPKDERHRRVKEMVDLVRLGDYLNVNPGMLSGDNSSASRLREPSPLRLVSCSWTNRSPISMKNSLT